MSFSLFISVKRSLLVAANKEKASPAYYIVSYGFFPLLRKAEGESCGRVFLIFCFFMSENKNQLKEALLVYVLEILISSRKVSEGNLFYKFFLANAN